jgi:hypothetical protein
VTANQPKLQRLGFYEEAVGVLKGLNKNEAFLVAQIGKLEIVLPHELEGKLHPFFGMKIGVLRTDIPAREYLVRSMPSLRACPSSGIPEAQCSQGGA